MAKIEWHVPGSNEFHYGVSHGVLYPQTSGTYPKGVAFNGISALDQNPSGAEETAIWADNVKYASVTSAEEWAATLSAYTYPDEFKECDGIKVVDGVQVHGQKRRPFGMCWRTEIGTDTWNEEAEDFELHLAYGCKVKPSQKQAKTVNQSPDVQPFSWEISSVPVPVGGGMKETSYLSIKSTDITDKDKLQALLDVLYGTETTEPRLPLPSEVFSIIKNGVQ